MDAVIDPILVPAAPPRSGGSPAPNGAQEDGPSFAEHLATAAEGEDQRAANQHEAAEAPDAAPVALTQAPPAQPAAIVIQLAAAAPSQTLQLPQDQALPTIAPAAQPAATPAAAIPQASPAQSNTPAPAAAPLADAPPQSVAAPPADAIAQTQGTPAAQPTNTAPQAPNAPVQAQQQPAAPPVVAEQTKPGSQSTSSVTDAAVPPVIQASDSTTPADQPEQTAQAPAPLVVQQLAAQIAAPQTANAKPQETASTTIDTAKGRTAASVDPNAKTEPDAKAPEPANIAAPPPKAAAAQAQAAPSESALKAAAAPDPSSAPPPAPHMRATSETAAPEAARATAPPAAHQVAREIVRRFNGGTTQFEIRLDPAELGRVDVRMEVSRDNRVTAVVTADNPQALTELARGARDIAQALQSAGLDLSENGLSFDLAQRGDRDAAPEGQRGGGAGGQTEETNAPQAPARLIGLERWRGVRVDLVA